MSSSIFVSPKQQQQQQQEEPEQDRVEVVIVDEEEQAHTALKATLSDLPYVPERFVLQCSICKQQDETFGITIVGGTDSISGGVFIKSVSAHGVCGRDGSVQIGDQILELNGRDMTGVTHAEAVEVFRSAGNRINVVVSRLVDTKSEMLAMGGGDVSSSCSSSSSQLYGGGGGSGVRQCGLLQFHETFITAYESERAEEEPFLLEHKGLGSKKIAI